MVQINIQFLAKELEKTFTVRYNRLRWDKQTLEAPMLFQNDPDMSNSYVYVAVGATLEESTIVGKTVICAGEPPFEPMEDDYSLLICDTEDVLTLYNEVQKSFLRIRRWEMRLRKAATADVNLQSTLELAAEELPMSMLYLNSTFTLLSSVMRPELSDVDPTEFAMGLLSYAELSHSEEMDAPCYYLLEEPGYRCYMVNFHYSSDYRGKLLLVSPVDGGPGEWAEILIDELCEDIHMLYRLFTVSSVRTIGYRIMQRTLKAMLEPHDEPDDMRQIRLDGNTALQSALWNINDSYRVFFIPFVGNEALVSRGAYLLTLLENRWNVASQGSSRGVILSNGICWVVNLSRPSEIDVENYCPALRELAESFDASVGVSTVSHDFYDLHRYKMQAALAARIGAERDAEKRVYLFSDYALDYMISGTTGIFRPEDMIHPCIPLLIEYDRENHSDLCKTLRLYMQYQYNILQASSILFIHRSTFSVRIKRIETMCNISLEDERTRLHILMSFYILDANGISYME